MAERKSKPRTEDQLVKAGLTKGAKTAIKRAYRMAKKADKERRKNEKETDKHEP